MHYGILSKMDEGSHSDRLNFLLPCHEYFHQSFVVVDCANVLLREKSRGSDGGVFFEASMLKRKEAKHAKAKDAIDELKDFMFLKGEVRFCHYFIHKYKLDPTFDNTPDLIKSANWVKKGRISAQSYR